MMVDLWLWKEEEMGITGRKPIISVPFSYGVMSGEKEPGYPQMLSMLAKLEENPKFSKPGKRKPHYFRNQRIRALEPDETTICVELPAPLVLYRMDALWPKR